MNVILLDNVQNLGRIGDLVKVKSGYGRNFLIPQGKAALATPENVKAIDARRGDLEKAAAVDRTAAEARAKTFAGVELVIPANAGGEGKLFGSVGPIDIADAFTAIQIAVERSEVRLADGPFHDLGEYTVSVHLHPDVNVDVALRIVAAG